jgi:hypothetical protein
MKIDMESALNDKIIHLTEDNMSSLRFEVSSVRGALRAKFPNDAFDHIMPYLDPENIIPEDCLFERIIGPDEEKHLYGLYGWTLRADRVPYSIYLTKFVGIQTDVDTPFIEELLQWVHKINNDEEVPCRNSQWRHNIFKKRRDQLKSKLVGILQREIMELLMVSHHFKNGTLVHETGFFEFYAAMFQKKLLSDGLGWS